MDNLLAFSQHRLTTIPDRDSFLNEVQEMLPFLTDIHIKVMSSTSQDVKEKPSSHGWHQRRLSIIRLLPMISLIPLFVRLGDI